jgi:prepilin-type N-terminal cleavage/methylation domain-containing protein
MIAAKIARRRSGMTLVELVVALTITAMAVGVGFATFGSLADRRERADAEADAEMRALASRATLASWLRNTRLTIEEDEIVFRGLHGVHREPLRDLSDDELTFFTSARTPVSNHGTIVRLHVERSDSLAKGLIADLVEWPGGRRDRVIIEPSVGGLSFSFITSPMSAQPALTSWVSTTVLPAGLRLTLLPRTGDSLPAAFRPMMTISIENGR